MLRSASGTFVAPERLISSLVTTDTAAAAPPSGSGVPETEVTATDINSSTLSFLSSATEGNLGTCASKMSPPSAPHRTTSRPIAVRDENTAPIILALRYVSRHPARRTTDEQAMSPLLDHPVRRS